MAALAESLTGWGYLELSPPVIAQSNNLRPILGSAMFPPATSFLGSGTAHTKPADNRTPRLTLKRYRIRRASRGRTAAITRSEENRAYFLSAASRRSRCSLERPTKSSCRTASVQNWTLRRRRNNSITLPIGGHAREAYITIHENDPPSILGKATEAVRDVTEVVQATSESIAWAIEGSRRPGRVVDQLTRLIRPAPLGSLALAFLVGLMFARWR